MPDSAALVRFRESLGLARELLLLESQYVDPPPPADQAAVQGLRGGAAVLMVGAFETFLREMIAEHLVPFATHPPKKPLTMLPERLQIASIFSSLKSALDGPRHGKPGARKDRLADIRLSAMRVHTDILDAKALSDTRGNPGPATVREVLGNLGIRDVFTAIRPEFDSRWPKPEAATFLSDKLEEIVNRRHRVAHAIDVLSISRAELTSSAKFLMTFSETLDTFVATHVSAY